MPKPIFVNLPVADPAAARALCEAIGAAHEPRFTDDSAPCMVPSESIHVMPPTDDRFSRFTPRRIADAHAASEVLSCIPADSREAVGDDQVAMSPGQGCGLRGRSHLIVTGKALAAAGREPRRPRDFGFMDGRSFEDPDGHVREPMRMDVAAFEAAAAGAPSVRKSEAAVA